ncbi:DUF7696 family protein [Chitiniphilus eburneus]|uniref:Uncharacterized protein n=1 Tax=Chitiniphilus eburneus TaxID=2571148 RepID=A0A4U0PXB3_9NEIS|nr:hypothetical protein [Chitiniphilus eburneus]TJZ73179.1 hypothetical protein FAZ21_11210 [Chitiniphilus eburneus]
MWRQQREARYITALAPIDRQLAYLDKVGQRYSADARLQLETLHLLNLASRAERNRYLEAVGRASGDQARRALESSVLTHWSQRPRPVK